MAQIYGFYAYRQARGRKFSAAGICPPPPAGGWGGLADGQGRFVALSKAAPLCHASPATAVAHVRNSRCTHVPRLLHACATVVARRDGRHGACLGNGVAGVWGTAGCAPGHKEAGQASFFSVLARQCVSAAGLSGRESFFHAGHGLDVLYLPQVGADGLHVVHVMHVELYFPLENAVVAFYRQFLYVDVQLL